MALDLTNKRFAIASDSAKQASTLLAAVDQLAEDARLLAQAGGNFDDADFAGTASIPSSQAPIYLSAYLADVFLQSVVPAIETSLDAHLGNDAAQPMHRESLEIMASGPA